MNKLIFIVLIILSNPLISQELCDSSGVKNASQLEKAQDCLIVQMENINVSLKDIDEYVEYTIHITEQIIIERILCDKYSALYYEDPSTVSSGIMSLCDQAREKRLVENARVLNEMNKMKPKVSKLKNIKSGLELELEIITQMAPLFGITIPPY